MLAVYVLAAKRDPSPTCYVGCTLLDISTLKVAKTCSACRENQVIGCKS